MYEIFVWSEAYPKKDFKFPWKIAEFVIQGQRLPQLDNMTDEQFELITKTWCQIPEERLKINKLIEELENLFNSNSNKNKNIKNKNEK